MTYSDNGSARRISLPEGLVAEVYPFSDYISCINVYRQGICVKSFCSDRSSIEEWLEEPGMIFRC
ncbi:hypothetical protein GCM10010965_16150 [Caldalkalibacillus thermarum]|uniref:hypothetical protein n=1 Tax=Caldalkalibacillus thermarum TaxID=296745 RepID=UPI001667E0B6|nr:hypothetical protein [Caldalkalibacillus thermarum]GGK24155.1 hypothetical protein GCM10010965_16150 [Caldalkalibacillus thermarum]